jgi:hypothetical protein
MSLRSSLGPLILLTALSTGSACVTVGRRYPKPPVDLVPAGTAVPRPAPTSFDEAFCRVDLVAARALASGPVEVALAEELDRAWGRGPDLDRLVRMRADATPEQVARIDPALGFWGPTQGASFVEMDEVERRVHVGGVPAESDHVFEVPLRTIAAYGHTELQVLVGGVPRWLVVVDTGASATVLSDAVLPADAERLGELTFDNVGNQGSGSAAVVDLGFGDVVAREHAVMVLPAATLRLGARTLDGILGWPVLSRYRMELDFQAGVARFGPPGPPADPPTLRSWSGSPFVVGSIQGHEALLWLDTGGGFSALLHGARERGIPLPTGVVTEATVDSLTGRRKRSSEVLPYPVHIGLDGWQGTWDKNIRMHENPRTDFCFDGWLMMDAFYDRGLLLDATAGEVGFLR